MTVSRSQSQRAAILILPLLLLAGRLPARAESQAEPEKQDDPRKPAWKWTLDERLAARFDPEAMAAREAERQAEISELRKSWVDPLAKEKAKRIQTSVIQESLDGWKTPELFLPGELFDLLLHRGFPQERPEHNLQGFRQEFRNRIEAQGAALGLGQDFWNRLEKTVLPYLQEDRHPIFSVKFLGEEEDIRLCRLRAQALEAAEAELGEEGFLRFLYETVAPEVGFTRAVGLGPGPPSFERYEEELRFQEEGCR